MKVYLVIKDSGELDGDGWADAYAIFATMELAKEYVQKTMEESYPQIVPHICPTEVIDS
jgi:hypothetical protein